MFTNTQSIVFNGNTASVRLSGRNTQIKGDGRISWGESHVKGLDLADIRDTRVSDYIQSGDLSDLGKGWKVPESQVDALSPSSNQWLGVDHKNRKVAITTHTGWVGVEHVAQADFDATTHEINPKTIVEFYQIAR